MGASLLSTSFASAKTSASDAAENVRTPSLLRPVARGKFIFVGETKLLVRGVTYGPFRPEPDGSEYHDPTTVRSDFRAMRDAGFNSVRTYTLPPSWMLDLAAEHDLRLMIGLPWEQHIAFMDSRSVQRDIEQRVADAVRQCAAHPAVLCYAIGNEIPSHIARWHGRRRVEQFLHTLYSVCKEHDPEGLVTYANFPPTEYLELPFLDLVSFNVYLETQPKLEAYLARLQNIAHDRPLLITELGLDALRNGQAAQASMLDWQLRATMTAGACGTFVFSWTDEWFRGGMEVEGWEFGLTSRDRTPKPSLQAVQRAFTETPFPPQVDWPRVSVVVCTYNGGATLQRCLDGVQALDYPNLEVIVVNDGSTDDTSAIASRYPVKLISTANCGLSSARNTGWREASGEIIAYLDDDAWPDPEWLKYLATSFLRTAHVGIGGPNIPPPGQPLGAQAVAHSPGGPSHVLITDTLAEHIPGCNMAFRRSALEAIGGFDEQFRIAGDDVDVCWQLQKRGWTLGFNPAAMVWHLRRSGVARYWKQQLNYGRAEAMLERKWPEKYNALGNPTWEGRLYGKGILRALGQPSSRIYHGTWGSALFQSVYHREPALWSSLPMTPEWYLLLGGLALLASMGLFWSLLQVMLLPLAIALAITFTQAAVSAIHGLPSGDPRTSQNLWRLRLLTTWLHLIQPAARLLGKLRTGLTPWRRRGAPGLTLPRSRSFQLWSKQWRSLEDRLCEIEADLRAADAVVIRGGDFDSWDLEIRGGMVGSARLKITVEEHGNGMQMVRLRVLPRCNIKAGVLATVLIAVSDLACFNYEWETWAISGIAGVAILLMIIRDVASAMGSVVAATRNWEPL